ncbi:NVEALA domain-containing protein [Bacteroides sp. L10-4]|jgi:hypothetical protein|uniref:NVEALA domain-containing protein n=1 Tax=Bacteroides sp. L10-4 TaxID=2746063 RepID=UPI001595DE90|nr:NVEALA domain-containing protein [Bacteroides sp. L10-4]NVK94899.1 hypothetical protein [Bacteroides sp. L10-4]
MNKIFKITLVAAVAAVAGYGVYANQKTEGVSDLVLDDVEAIAACEVSASGPNKGACVKDVNTSREFCVTGGWGPACSATI